jgi:hypothetical protein
VLVLDNLFLNIDVARALLVRNVATCGITRKNAAGFPSNYCGVVPRNTAYVVDCCLNRRILIKGVAEAIDHCTTEMCHRALYCTIGVVR